MQVDVSLAVTLRKGRFTRKTVPLADGGTVTDLLRQLSLPDGQVAVAVVNGRHVAKDSALQPGDVVALFPHVGGG